MDVKISVIVPIYKVEPYLNQCVQSIINQTYCDLEIILVDDGSPDICPELCDEWAARDERIKVIHKANGGLSDARNAGISESKGNFIGFVDGDDYIAPDMYEHLIKNLLDTDSAVSVCGVKMIWDGSSETRMLTREGNRVLNNLDAMQALLEESWLKQPVWNKLYRRDVIEGIHFEKGKYHEDVFWSYQVIARANQICVFDTPCYFYRQRKDSIMGEAFSRKRLDALEAKKQRIDFLKTNYPQFANAEIVNLYFACIYDLQVALRTCKKDDINDIEISIKPYIEWALDIKEAFYKIPVKQKIWLKISKKNLYFACRLRNLLKIGL